MNNVIAKSLGVVLVTASMALTAAAAGQNQLQAFTPSAQTPLITQYVDAKKLVTLTGNTHPAATVANDRGAVPEQMRMSHMYLQLKRSPAQEKALAAFVDSLHDANSPNYHQWITPNELGRRFGIAQSDIDAVANWLRNQGFQINYVHPNMVIDFSGTAGQVHNAFRTEIHYLDVKGQRQYANMSDPQIPAALAPAVSGVVGLNNFKFKAMNVPKNRNTATPTDTAGGNYFLAPYDIYKIYNFPGYSPTTFPTGVTGKGVTIAILSQSDVYSDTTDWNTFRNTLGIPTSVYTDASLTTIHPPAGAGGTCTAPGVTIDAGEAALDVEWSAAAAPDANIELVSCAEGIFVAMQNLLTNGSALPNVISISYGESEQALGASNNSFINGLYQMAAADGISVFVASGDSGADAQDQGTCTATTCDTHGINVSGLASTPYNVAVGGTDFEDVYLDQSSTYWAAASSTGPKYVSALSYIPEMPWNDSCGSTLIAAYLTGSFQTYGADGFCNSIIGEAFFIDNQGGGGGKSHCATGTGVSCAGYAKPFFQTVLGNPGDKVRDIPDVALFAAAGYTWGHAYIICWSQNASCSGTPDTWTLVGGTSVAAPIWAGIQALVVQKTGQNWGNPDANYYSLARTEYGSAGTTTCKSDLGNGVASTCTFYDVTSGDIDMVCTGTRNCYNPDGSTYGVLSSSSASYLPAFAAAKGWDFATGIGTPNVRNLVNAMAGGTKALFLAPTDGSILPSTSFTFKWSAGRNVAYYQLWIGTTPGASDVYSGPTTTAHAVTLNNLPSNGETLYLTLWSEVGTKLQSATISVTAFTAAAAPIRGAIAPL